MRVLVACEFSGIVREAFRARGHDAVSCDLLESELPGPHLQCDVRTLDLNGYDLMIAHPPCTYLAVSGARWFSDPARLQPQENALDFVRWLMQTNVPRVAIENPVSIISTRIRKPDDIIQPHWFGHPYTKTTCLWLKNLPILIPTNNVAPHDSGTKNGTSIYQIYSSSTDRSRTFAGVADAMADQWGKLEPLR